MLKEWNRTLALFRNCWRRARSRHELKSLIHISVRSLATIWLQIKTARMSCQEKSLLLFTPERRWYWIPVRSVSIFSYCGENIQIESGHETGWKVEMVSFFLIQNYNEVVLSALRYALRGENGFLHGKTFQGQVRERKENRNRENERGHFFSVENETLLENATIWFAPAIFLSNIFICWPWFDLNKNYPGKIVSNEINVNIFVPGNFNREMMS